MANVLSLALKITGDASGLKLDPVQRALQRLGEQADELSNKFTKFAGDSSAAAEAQARIAERSRQLINALRDGAIGATEFAAEMEKLSQAADAEAQAFERAAALTEANRTEIERFSGTQTELRAQLDAGRITQDTYNRAIEQAAKKLTDAERAAAGLPPTLDKIADSGKGATLKFNELSGVFSALPGPIGSIAGRISGITSAGEGLSRVFSGGVTQGFSSLGASVAGLINPFTVGAAAILGFGAAAKAVTDGLLQLEDRVEKLGNTADKLGVSFQFIQTLEESARRSGTSIDAVSAAFGRLQKNVLGVDEESKAAQKALTELGVTAAEIQTLKPEEQYRLIAEKMSQIEDPARRTATAMALFGKAGADMLPFFKNLTGAATDIQEVGRALTAIDRGRIDDFGAGVDRLGVATQGLGQSLLLPFVGLGEGVARALAEVTGGITKIIDPIGRVLEPVFTQAGRIIQLFGTQLGNLGEIIGAVFEPFAVVVEGVATALEPLVDGMFRFLAGVSDAAVQVAKWVVSFTPIGQIAKNIEAVSEVVSRVVTIIVTAFQKAGEVILGFVGQVGEFIAQSPLLSAIGSTIQSVFGSISSVFSAISSAIGGTVGRLLTMAERFLGIQTAAEAAGEAATQAVDVGPPEGFNDYDKAITKTRELLNKAIDESNQFGQAGFDAALQFQTAVEELQRKADDGILNEKAYEQEVAKANEAYKQQIEIIKESAAESERRAKAEADNVQKIVDAYDQQQNIDQNFGGSAERAKAAENLLTIENEIARVEEEQRRAREAGDQKTLDAATERLAKLDQVAAKERDVASGAADEREKHRKEEEKRANESIAAAKKMAEEIRKTNEQIAEKTQALAEKQFEFDLERVKELSQARTGAIKVNDLRSGGIAQFFATLQEDPALSEAKKQTKELQNLRKDIQKLEATKVDILAGVG
jgi:phage-related protein